MEILAAIVGLESLKFPCEVTLYTDSQYLANGITKGWAKRWRSNGWVKPDKKPALNPDLWERLLDLCDRHDVTFVWVRGHAGHDENERCDKLSVAAASGANLPEDEVYTRGRR
jgi:ribonuclease HI